jgi:hypothetical protein
VAHFAGDLLALAELQCQLLAHDLRDAGGRGALSLALLTGGAIVAVAAIPIALAAVAWLLVDRAGLSRDVAFALTALAALGGAATLAWVGWRRLKSAACVLKRSGEELRQNALWIKTSLKNHETR